MREQQEAILKGARMVLKRYLHLKACVILLLIGEESTRLLPAIFAAASGACRVAYDAAFVSKKAQYLGKVFIPLLQRLLARVHEILVATTTADACFGRISCA